MKNKLTYLIITLLALSSVTAFFEPSKIFNIIKTTGGTGYFDNVTILNPPLNPTDATNKQYVDSQFGSTPSNILFNYDLQSVAENCTTYTDVNLSDTSICGSGTQSNMFFNTTSSSWTSTCCDYKYPKCISDSQTDVVDICGMKEYVNNIQTTLFSNDKWNSKCCDEEGQNCYWETSETIQSNTSICTKYYNTIAFSLTYDTTWNAQCCKEGLI